MAEVVSNDPGTITQPARITKGTMKWFPIGEKVYICDVCGRAWPKNLFTVFEGKRYCHSTSECYKDIQGIIRDRLPVRIPDDTEEDLK